MRFRSGHRWRSGWGPQGWVLACGVIAVVAVAVAVVVLATSSPASHHTATAATPAVVAPSSAAAASSNAAAGTSPGTTHAATGGGTAAAGGAATGSRQTVAEAHDPEESKSFPVTAKALAHRSSASTPTKAAEAYVAPGALSTDQIKQALGHIKSLEQAQLSRSIVPGGDSVGGNGTIPIPAGVPTVVQKVIAGANAITDYPYVYGGGHASFVDNAYDCSGSVGYALAAGGLLSHTETSGELESWGVPGPGKWITVWAAAGHVYMYVNVGGGVWMQYDTVGRSGPYSSRWEPDARSNAGFVARHWPGL